MRIFRFLIFWGVLFLGSSALYAQNNLRKAMDFYTQGDTIDYLQKTIEYLDAGDCDMAKLTYDIYLTFDNPPIPEVKRRIDQCVPQPQQTVLPITQPTVTSPEDCPPTVMDCEGHVYNTVKIGKQCWMKENLRAKKFDSTFPPIDKDTTINLYYYDFDYWRENPYDPYDSITPICDTTIPLIGGPTYGYLYNWAAVMGGDLFSERIPSGVQGICPRGWHIPSVGEWDQMLRYVSSKSEYVRSKPKEAASQTNALKYYYPDIANALASVYGWEPTTDFYAVGYAKGNNATGFSALPAGGEANLYLWGDKNELDFGSNAFFASSLGICLSLSYDQGSADLSGSRECTGRSNECMRVSIRCLRD